LFQGCDALFEFSGLDSFALIFEDGGELVSFAWGQLAVAEGAKNRLQGERDFDRRRRGRDVNGKRAFAGRRDESLDAEAECPQVAGDGLADERAHDLAGLLIKQSPDCGVVCRVHSVQMEKAALCGGQNY